MRWLEWLKAKLSSLEEQYTTKKDIVTERRMSLEEAITSIENSISDTYDDIARTQKSMDEKNGRIDTYQGMSSVLSLRIAKNRSTILSYLANIYSETHIIYDQDNNIDIIQAMILSDTSTDTISTDIVYKSLVSILGQKFIDEYKSLMKEYYRIALRIKEEVTLLETDKALLEKQKSALAAQRNQRENLLSITKWQEDLFEKYIDAQKRAQETVEKSWQDQSEAYVASLDTLMEKNGCKSDKKSGALTQKCAGILAFYRNERALRKLTVSTGTTNILAWPIIGTPTISAYFRDPSYFRTVGSQHDAIDIPVSQGTNIVAPADGYVYYILPPAVWGYSYIALKHPNGYMTVYGHLSEVLVSPYQFVQKGDVIARSGWAPGTPGAGPMTSGAHLHFEVYHDKTALDPLRVLDLSKLVYADLPPRYQDKYIADIIALSGTGTDISGYERRFVMKGESEESRQKYLLRTYATLDFQSWDMWVDTALEARIDPSFLMCVGLAETTLGNHLKTPYNIGNVWNTDSGGTYDFSSPKEGISWMVATFNNKFLSKYISVSELSRWWNPDGTIYASSNANWHNNIIRCLSSLKSRFVEDDYKFRVNTWKE